MGWCQGPLTNLLLLQVSGSVLRIPHISPDDSGKYICRAHNGAGTKEASITVTVQRATNSSHGKAK